jgi:hypothetical protein
VPFYGVPGIPAKKCISEAIQIFEQTEAEGFLKQAKEALACIEGEK